ncbi:MAG: ABC transporter substrate binding protein [Isosphaeraceae bacterium]
MRVGRDESRKWSRPAVWALVGIAAQTAGCGGVESTPPAKPPASAAAPASPAGGPAAGGGAKVAVVRLSDPLSGEEASEKDILEGLIQGGLEAGSVKVTTYDARGDQKAIRGLIDRAAQEGASVVMTLRAETSIVAAESGLKVPLVFALVGNPIGLKFGTGDRDHRPDLTGVYSAMQQSLIVPIARGCLPKAKALAVVFDPDDPNSVASKDALLKTEWHEVKPLTAPIHSDSEAASVVKSLIDQKAEGIILAPGLSLASARALIAEGRKAKLPSFGLLADHARNGALVARVAAPRWSGFEAGRRAARVLRGEPAKQVPFATGDNYKTYVNPTEAKALGVTLLGALMRDPIIVKTGDPAPSPEPAKAETKN